MSRAKWGATGNLRQLGRAEAEQPFAVAEQAVEHALGTVTGAGIEQMRDQVLRRDSLGEIAAYLIEQVAKCRFAVGIPYRLIEATRRAAIC